MVYRLKKRSIALEQISEEEKTNLVMISLTFTRRNTSEERTKKSTKVITENKRRPKPKLVEITKYLGKVNV